MRKRVIAASLGVVIVAAGAVTAYTITPTVHAGSPTEIPELGRTGDYNIATQVDTITLADRPLITASSALTGSADPAPRQLKVRFWYPTTASDGETAAYEHDISRTTDSALPIIFKGRAFKSAPAITDQKFPLIVMSHGYGGWAEHFSFLGEHIASRGYVVASINHADARPEGAVSFLLSFGNVLQNRALDQRELIDQLLSQAASQTAAKNSYAAAIDVEHIGLIGYSMGGYGALRTAGAPYDYEGEGLANLPDDSKQAMQQGLNTGTAINAVVALAPWGGAPNNRSWSRAGLEQITVPALIIAGNQDDVVNFKEGVSWLFDNAKNSQRNLLVYREARHNVVGNAITDPDFPANRDFATAEFMREPVWRTERLNAINQHFITAFLDLHLKGDTDKATYLTPTTTDSNDSTWPLSTGEQLNGTLAGPKQTEHWRGFQNRWAVGMEMRVKAKGE